MVEICRRYHSAHGIQALDDTPCRQSKPSILPISLPLTTVLLLMLFAPGLSLDSSTPTCAASPPHLSHHPQSLSASPLPHEPLALSSSSLAQIQQQSNNGREQRCWVPASRPGHPQPARPGPLLCSPNWYISLVDFAPGRRLGDSLHLAAPCPYLLITCWTKSQSDLAPLARSRREESFLVLNRTTELPAIPALFQGALFDSPSWRWPLYPEA